MSEVADVEDVTLWATMSSSDQAGGAPLEGKIILERSTRANQAQYVCVLEGRTRYYLGSLYQSSMLTPKMSELERPWHSRHVSQKDLRGYVDVQRDGERRTR